MKWSSTVHKGGDGRLYTIEGRPRKSNWRIYDDTGQCIDYTFKKDIAVRRVKNYSLPVLECPSKAQP